MYCVTLLKVWLAGAMGVRRQELRGQTDEAALHCCDDHLVQVPLDDLGPGHRQAQPERRPGDRKG